MSTTHNNDQLTSATTQFAETRANEFSFAKGSMEIGQVSASVKDLPMFQDMFVSASIMGGSLTKAMGAGLGAGLITQNPLVGGLVTAGVAIDNMFRGSSGKGPTRS